MIALNAGRYREFGVGFSGRVHVLLKLRGLTQYGDLTSSDIGVEPLDFLTPVEGTI